uniref:Uncharacterized protein n=1 Tax=Manihot esculenta TaxID=3983 RepID=A0A2C9U4B6_MANES
MKKEKGLFLLEIPCGCLWKFAWKESDWVRLLKREVEKNESESPT